MARDADALLIRKWAATGDVQTPEDRGLTRTIGWPADFATPGGRQPTREVFNQLFRELSALGEEINTRGLLDWDDGVAYVHPALVRGSDNHVYSSAQGGTNHDPVTDDGTYWERYDVAGWSPRLAVVPDGDRRVLQIHSWIGGGGDPPGSGQYIGATGLVPAIADATDIRGPQGDVNGVGVIRGGTSGQALIKNSNTDFDMRWGQMLGGYKAEGEGIRDFISGYAPQLAVIGNWYELSASTTADILILGAATDATDRTEFWIGAGPAGSESIIAVFKGIEVWFPIPISVASGTRLAARADQAPRTLVDLWYVRESDLAAITP